MPSRHRRYRLADGARDCKPCHLNYHAVALALLSAGLFGLSTPAAKLLLNTVDPAILAGPLLWRWSRRCRPTPPTPAPHIAWQPSRGGPGSEGHPLARRRHCGRRRCRPGPAHARPRAHQCNGCLASSHAGASPRHCWLGPPFTSTSTDALRQAWAHLSLEPLFYRGRERHRSRGLLGPLAIVGACVAWGLGSNFTRKVSLADPLQIVELKGLIAGPVNLLLGLWVGGALPTTSTIALAGFVGFLGYGVSVVLFVLALRSHGTARTGAYFSTHRSWAPLPLS